MSDSFPDLRRSYELYVRGEDEFPYSKGLFPIPEYPEDEACARAGMWSEALGALLATLRYLAPAMLLTIFWGHHSYIYRLLKHVHSALRSILFSSNTQRETVLGWLTETSPVHVECLEQVWRHGWILCGVVDGAMPGACAGHQRTCISIEHAQRLAEQYLGVEPVFTYNDFESESLSKHQECKLAHYLDRVRQALAKLSPPVCNQNSQRTAQESQAYTLDYVARGMGLCSAQTNKKMCFKIYPTAQQCLEPGEINILIRGPRDTRGTAVVPSIYGRAQLLRQAYLGVQIKSKCTESALPLTQGTVYLRTYGKNDMTKTYFIPKVKHEIDIEVNVRRDHARVTYTAALEGNYEISLVSRGYNLIGSPFKVAANVECFDYNTSTELDDDKECDIVDVKNDRRVVFRIVDFVTEKMLLNENGALEKISDEEAYKLIATVPLTDNNNDLNNSAITIPDSVKGDKTRNFKNIAKKVITMNQVCDGFKTAINTKKAKTYKNKKNSKQTYIPSIANYTIYEKKMSTYYENQDGIATSLNKIQYPDLNEKVIYNNNNNVDINVSTKSLYENAKDYPKMNILNHLKDLNASKRERKEILSNPFTQPCDDLKEMFSKPVFDEQANVDLADAFEQTVVTNILDDSNKGIYNVDQGKTLNTMHSNPFSQDIGEEATGGKILFNSFDSEDLAFSHEADVPIQIVIDTITEDNIASTNPFIDNEIIERPKTPILKIITGNIKDHRDSIFVDPKHNFLDNISSDEEIPKSNEFLNPFYVHKIYQNTSEDNSGISPVTDFVIGAPVSKPPFRRAPTPEPDMDSIILASNLEEALHKYDKKVQIMKHENKASKCNMSEFVTALPPSPTSFADQAINYEISSTFRSTEPNNTQSNINQKLKNKSLLNEYNASSDECSNKQVKGHHRELWDSAYVSIDETNSSPDTNNNDIENKIKTSIEDKSISGFIYMQEFFNMGPAERDIWQAVENENKIDVHMPYVQESETCEHNRKIFSPILEEKDRSIPNVLAKNEKQEPGTYEQESITDAFAELNDIYTEYFSTFERTSNEVSTEKEKFQSFEVNFSVADNKEVNSASEFKTDVMRHYTNEEVIDPISGVQSNATESSSASQALSDLFSTLNDHTNGQGVVTVFGGKTCENLVNERKKYWDEKIKSIEEMKQREERKRKMSTKKSRNNDSLSKRRGKNIVKNFIHAANNDTPLNQHAANYTQNKIEDPTKEIQTEVNLVHKWKKFWDEKLETEEVDFPSPKTEINKSLRNKLERTISINISTEEDISSNKKVQESSSEEVPIQSEVHSSTKDITDEKIFKAFETSPKRFFGTSRKQILEKIDDYLETANTEKEHLVSGITSSKRYGIVNSRISWFNTSVENINKSYKKNGLLQKQPSFSEIYVNKVSVDKENKIVNKNSSNNDSEALSPKQIRNKLINEPQISLTAEKCCEKTRSKLRKMSVSKSEMDIFNKTQSQSNNTSFYTHKSCEDLPKVNVKNFISLFEKVTESIEMEEKNDMNHITDIALTNNIPIKEHVTRNVEILDTKAEKIADIRSDSDKLTLTMFLSSSNQNRNNISTTITEISNTEEYNVKIKATHDEDATRNYENTSPQLDTQTHEAVEYKKRFEMAKQFFQSMQELPNDTERNDKQNECEMILYSQSTEYLQNKSLKLKQTVKAHSAPTSDYEYDNGSIDQWEQNSTCTRSRKLIKISEKFNVEDLFNDVAGEGKLSREGSFRGIPNKHAVLAAFKSMENISKLSSYEMSTTQLTEFAKENQIKNAQTHLTEYPYLPQTEPSKYRSRVDSKAFGLISRKELLRRRNSLPNVLRLNEHFTTTL